MHDGAFFNVHHFHTVLKSGAKVNARFVGSEDRRLRPFADFRLPERFTRLRVEAEQSGIFERRRRVRRKERLRVGVARDVKPISIPGKGEARRGRGERKPLENRIETGFRFENFGRIE